MSDILFKTDEYIFSYRVAGICIEDGKILLQKPTNDDGYAFPGGHVAFGETNEETLKREFTEETGIEISVGELKWVGEIFFDWGERRCHQICLYYEVKAESALPDADKFTGKEHLEGRNFDIEFYLVPLEKIDGINLYPTNAKELLKDYGGGVKHFIYRE